jgi:hypothetical protein
MGIFDWLRRRKNEPATNAAERTPGGSTVRRYAESVKPKLGLADEAAYALKEAREAAYERLFGPCETVLHEMVPMIPHIDVLVFPAGHAGRDFVTLATSGMSDVPMTTPPDCRDYARAELIFYCDRAEPIFQNILRELARFPHDNRTWLAETHTMPNGQPPRPLFPGHAVDGLFFMPTIVAPEDALDFKIEGQPLRLLWVVPLTPAEMALKLEEGAVAIYDLFNRVDHPHVFSLAKPRASYV